MAKHKIQAELHRLEKLLREKIQNVKDDAHDNFQEFFDINKHLKDIIIGVSTEIIIDAIFKAVLTSQDALIRQKLVGKFVDMELIKHVKIIDILFIEFYIINHLDRNGIMGCFSNVNVNLPMNIPSNEKLWPCIDNQLKQGYTTELINATPENTQIYKTYKEEIEKRIVEVATLKNKLFSLTQTVDTLDAQMSQASIQLLQALSSQSP